MPHELLGENQINNCGKILNMKMPTLVDPSKLSCRLGVAGTYDLTKLAKLYIKEYHELEEWPNLSRPSCSEQIEIVSKLEKLYIKECPELEELLNLSRLSCLEQIEIVSFEKL